MVDKRICKKETLHIQGPAWLSPFQSFVLTDESVKRHGRYVDPDHLDENSLLQQSCISRISDRTIARCCLLAWPPLRFVWDFRYPRLTVYRRAVSIEMKRVQCLWVRGWTQPCATLKVWSFITAISNAAAVLNTISHSTRPCNLANDQGTAIGWMVAWWSGTKNVADNRT